MPDRITSQSRCPATPARGFLGRLRRDERGNTLAIMAAAIFPLAGLVGGGVDMSRLYLAKTRLQQACDAGALAGRKVMGGATWASNSNAPNTAALNFFDSNFQQGAYGTGTRTRAFSEAAGKVTGTASVVVPMTIMKIFGNMQETLTATCDAEMRLPNTDVMFVLDTTGSMGSKAISTDTQTKMEGLKEAVKCFYETVARLDTAQVCAGGTPSGGTGSNVQVRFGFVPYTTNVNVGKLLPTAWFADSWNYQSRKAVPRPETTYTFPTAGNPATASTTEENMVYGPNTGTNTYTGIISDADCQAKVPTPQFTTRVTSGPESAPYNEVTVVNGATRTVTWDTRQPSSDRENGKIYDSGNRVCYVGYRSRTYDYIRHYSRTDKGTPTVRDVFDRWAYGPTEIDLRGLKNGTSWNASMLYPIGDTADGAPTTANKTIAWDGCIEERTTVKQSTYSPIPAGALDLNIDLTPNSSKTGSFWAPALPGLIYARGATDWNAITTYNNTPFESKTNFASGGGYYCPAEAKKLQAWPAANQFTAYVDGLTPNGNTYHDIGMIWGARLLSPTGIFRSENEFTGTGAAIERHMIFMTDGDAQAGNNDYAAYGLPWFDRRQTSTNPPTGTELIDQINARFPAICTYVKNQNITLWVISFGAGSNATTEARLSACATPGRYFAARDSATLQATFTSIANQISQLRLTS